MFLEKFEPIAFHERNTIFYGLFTPDWGFYGDSILVCFSKKCELPQFFAYNTSRVEIPRRKFEYLRELPYFEKEHYYKWKPSPEEYNQITKILIPRVTATKSPEYRKKHKEALNSLKSRNDKNRKAFSTDEIYGKVYQKLHQDYRGSATGAGTIYILSNTNSMVG